MAGVDDAVKSAELIAKYGDDAVDALAKYGGDAAKASAELAGKGLSKAGGFIKSAWGALTGAGEKKAKKEIVKKVVKSVKPVVRNPKTGKVNLALTIPKAAIEAGVVYNLNKALKEYRDLRGPNRSDVEQLSGSWRDAGLPAPGTTAQVDPTEAAIKAYMKAAKEALGAGGGGGGGGGGSSSSANIDRLYGILTGRANEAGAASIAAMENIARRAAQASQDIRTGGTQAAANVGNIYNTAAATAAEGAKLAGVEGSSLTPVSGMAAVAPQYITSTGQTLSDYLLANNLIDAQTAGYMSNLANLQRRAYADDIARQNQMFITTDKIRRAEEARRAATAAANSRASALQQIMLQGAKMRLEADLKRAEKANAPIDTTFMNARMYQDLEDQWDEIKKDKRVYQSYKDAGITNVDQYAANQIALLKQQSQG